jgi:hypothetical protein
LQTGAPATAVLLPKFESNMRVSHILFAVMAGICVIDGVTQFSATSRIVHQDTKTVALYTAVSSSHNLPAFVEVPPPAITEPDIRSEAQSILAADPEDTDGRFAASLNNLCRTGQFQAALKLAGEAPSDLQADLMKIIFSRWAQSGLADALKSLNTISDPGLHGVALRAVFDGCGIVHSGDLAAYAFALPPGDDRDYALGTALSNWSLQDPAALGTWLNTLPRGNEYDYGVALMIQKTDGANRPPEIAVEWVESVTDPALKQDLLLRVLDEWAKNDSAAAQQYVSNAAWLDDSQRQQARERVSRTLAEKL